MSLLNQLAQLTAIKARQASTWLESEIAASAKQIADSSASAAKIDPIATQLQQATPIAQPTTQLPLPFASQPAVESPIAVAPAGDYSVDAVQQLQKTLAALEARAAAVTSAVTSAVPEVVAPVPLPVIASPVPWNHFTDVSLCGTLNTFSARRVVTGAEFEALYAAARRDYNLFSWNGLFSWLNRAQGLIDNPISGSTVFHFSTWVPIIAALRDAAISAAVDADISGGVEFFLVCELDKDSRTYTLRFSTHFCSLELKKLRVIENTLQSFIAANNLVARYHTDEATGQRPVPTLFVETREITCTLQEIQNTGYRADNNFE